MKQAILITAYNDFDQLIKLINEFDDYFSIYIHIDKKSEVKKEILQALTEKKNVKYVGQDFKVNWGGINHLKSYLKLSKIALNDSENVYFHLITGKDYPVKSVDYFKMLINTTGEKNKDYLHYFPMPAACWKNGGMDRLEYYNLYDLFNAKKSDKWIWRFNRLQAILNFKRQINHYLGKLYGGSTYWSLSRDTLQFVLNFTKENPRFIKRFKYTFCAEEIYFQTIIMNSKYAKNVVNNNLRFIDWESGKGGYPAFLDEDDFQIIIKSDKLFARKINIKENKLVQLLTMHKDNK